MFLWWSTAGLLDRQTVAAIEADAQSLTERYDEAGLPALVLTIEDRLTQDVEDDAIYLLVGPQGQRIAGNLQHWPQGAVRNGDWYELSIERAGMRSLALVQSLELQGGLHLLIGRDVQVRAQLRSLLTDALLWALLVVLVMATGGALVVRSLFRRALAQRLGHRRRDRGRRLHPAGETVRPRRRVRSARRDDQRHAGPHGAPDGGRARGIERDRARPAHADHPRARPVGGRLGARRDGRRNCAPPIERATADLDGIVAVFQALLRIAEIEAGSRRAAFTTLDVAPLLADVAELYGAVAEENGIALTVQAPERLPAFGDRELIQQAVANLVDNAVKFSPPGGAVRLSATEAPTGVEIAVADQGPGIPEADRARAAERFFRGESARNTPGSGLGLALVQAVAQLHGGSLRLADTSPGLIAILSLPGHEEPVQVG